MIKQTLIILLTLIVGNNMLAQSYYLPYNLKKAYTIKNTRSLNGKPGKNYFQNEANYEIKAHFNPITGELKGQETIEYINNSPDSLYYFVLRLYHDVFKEGNLRDEQIAPEFITKGVKVSSFKINNIELVGSETYYLKRHGTNLYASLNKYFLPGETILLEVEWETALPQGHLHRFGNYGDGNWFGAYWYPQIAVYDDIDGWDVANYTGLYEFYNDINNFSVEITIESDDYMLWATGDWINPNEVLAPTIMNRRSEAMLSDEVVQVVTEKDWKKKNVLIKKKEHIFKFKAEKVPDFAFAVSGNYLWDAASRIVDSASGRRTTIHTVYPVKASKEFSPITKIGVHAIQHFSNKALEIPYPYSNVTIFNGDGGMEFPMMVNMQSKSIAENTFTAMHEIFHGYFPFYTGLNERKYAWLDEGLTGYLAIETEAVISSKADYPLQKYIDYYNLYSGNDQESPLFTPTVQTRSYNYYHQAYYRSATALSVLERYLGRDTFRQAVKEFVERWKLKHPTGYDFIFTLEDYCDEDLSWLIIPWFFDNGWADLAISEVSESQDGLSVVISNIGGFPVPVELKVIPVEGDSYFIKRKADVWKEKQKVIIELPKNIELKRLELGNLNVPDKDSENNYHIFK